MDIDDLRLLVDVAQLGSFAAAARARDMDPSSVSRVVAQVERELGLRVFQRTTRRLSLTEAGEIYLQRVAPLVDELTRAHDDAIRLAATPTGTLRVTTSVAFGQTLIVPLLGQFRAAFPKLEFDLIMSDANLDLVQDRIDIAVRLAPVISGDLICAKLRPTRYRVCASPEYLDAAAPLTQPEDLQQHSCLLFTLPAFQSRWVFRDRAGTLTEVAVAGQIRMSNAIGLRDAACASLGPALLADWLIENDLESGRLIDVFPTCDVTATTFDTAAWIVYPSRAYVPAKVRLFSAFLRTHL
ncbi:MAG: LysR family transcriptional regulator [Pseudomonadota bacterium]